MKLRKKLLVWFTMVLLITACFSFPAMADTKSNNEPVTVVLKGTHFEIGKQYGEQAKDEIKSNLEFLKKGFEAKEVTQQQLADATKALEETLSKEAPHMIEEMKGMAEGSEISYEDILVLNAQAYVKQTEGCTTILATGKATKDGKVYFQKNRDASRLNQVVMQIQPDEGYKLTVIADAGFVGVAMGINEKGLATGNNYLPTWDVDQSVGNLDNFIMNRLILERAASVREAAELIESLPRLMGANYPIADKEEAAHVETSHSGVAVKWVVDEAIAHTNHYILPGMEKYNLEQIGESSKKRLERANELLKEDFGKLDIHRIISISEDHDESEPNPNNWIDRNPENIYMGTVSAGTFDSSKLRMWAQIGQPSTTPEVLYKVGKLKVKDLESQIERLEKMLERLEEILENVE